MNVISFVNLGIETHNKSRNFVLSIYKMIAIFVVGYSKKHGH